jgi:uncharacterized OB-fold protein
MTDTDDTRAKATRIEPPEPSDATKTCWDATRERQLMVQWCLDCEQPVWFPREVCPGCLGTNLEYRPSSGHGEVYAASVHHIPANPLMEPRLPYVVALVALDDGVRLLTNVVGCDPDEATVGRRVHVAWEPLTDGRNLPVFELT